MKTRVTLLIYPRQQEEPVVRKILEDAGCDPEPIPGSSLVGSYSHILQFDESDQRLLYLRSALSSAAITRTEKREHIFTVAELETAPLLYLIDRSRERGSCGPEYGTEYDLSQACPRCGTGAIQVSSLRLNPSEIPKRGTIFQTYDHLKLVSPELAQALANAGITGLELRRAQAYKSLAPLPWYQLLAHAELPPMAPTSRGILRENPCPLCGRDGYFHSANEPIEIEYSGDEFALDDLPDIANTYEFFGNSVLRVPFENSRFAQPLLLVKPKVFRVIQEHKVRNVEFIPVSIVTGE